MKSVHRLVDDNATNRRLLFSLLRSWKCRNDEASDGKTALKKLKAAAEEKDPFSIAILDLLMPEMDGETLGKIIKEDPLLNETKLIMMTSFGKRGDARRFEDIGFSAYLTKPVKQHHLYGCLLKIHSGDEHALIKSGSRIDKYQTTYLIEAVSQGLLAYIFHRLIKNAEVRHTTCTAIYR